MNGESKFLPYGRHTIDEADIESVVSVLRSGALTNGPVVADFEVALAKLTGAKDAISCSSGTAALHLAMAAFGVERGDYVIVPTLTFLASASAVRYVNADVIFADVDASTGLMTPESFQAALDQAPPGSVKAAVAVHLNGQCCDMAELAKIARVNDVAIIEDACHAIGGHYRDAGSSSAIGSCEFSEMSCFSFHPVKTVAMGEGGAITTNSAPLAQRMKTLRNHGMERTPDAPQAPNLALSPEGEPNPWYYEMANLGWNYRASDIHCALGLSQLKKIESNIEQRAALVARYDELLTSLSPIVQPIARVGGRVAWHLYVVHIDFKSTGMTRAALMNTLSAAGIGTQVHYLPVHLQPYYKNLYGPLQLPGAEKYYESCLSLPLFPAMNESDVDRVVGELERIVERQ